MCHSDCGPKLNVIKIVVPTKKKENIFKKTAYWILFIDYNSVWSLCHHVRRYTRITSSA